MSICNYYPKTELVIVMQIYKIKITMYFEYSLKAPYLHIYTENIKHMKCAI